jgi:Multimeric flavodoxin WrbA
MKTKKIAIVYYSMSGNAHYIAEKLAETLEGETDIIRLEPVMPYAEKGAMKFIGGGKAAVFGEKPELKMYSFEPKEYDMVILGTPVWAGTFAPPLRTFMLHNKLNKMNVALFATSDSGNAEKCFEKLAKYLKKSNIMGTLSMTSPAKNKTGDALYEIRKFASELNEARK